MLDFASLKSQSITIADLAADLTPHDLHDLTNEMIDTILHLIDGCTDHDVTFTPNDPNAHDHAAATPEELHIPWTLAHLIVHTTASAEEAAFLAAEMARGVLRDGRSRHETHWTTITTLDQCLDRLAESRRIHPTSESPAKPASPASSSTPSPASSRVSATTTATSTKSPTSSARPKPPTRKRLETRD